MRGFRYPALIVASLLAGALALAGCGRDTTALGQIQPGDTVYADLWNEDADEGDQALVEQKPSGLWVIDTSVHFREKRSGDYVVEIMLDPELGTFVIVDMGGVKVGEDHDDCLSMSDSEHYALMKESDYKFEKSVGSTDNSNDDCVVV